MLEYDIKIVKNISQYNLKIFEFGIIRIIIFFKIGFKLEKPSFLANVLEIYNKKISQLRNAKHD
jgi:hypothetical protein